MGWEFEVPLTDVEEARLGQARELEAFYRAPVELLSDEEVARYLVRRAAPSARYLRPEALGGLGPV